MQTLSRIPEFCIYATGSYGRMQAGKNSDIDLFLVRHNDQKRFRHRLQNTSQIKDVTKVLKELKLRYSKQFLRIHYFPEMLVQIGGPRDDFENHFTARMLLLLESQPILNDNRYNLIVNRTVKSYYRDYHEHEKDFRPLFLVNDIVRFWKTLCLNYEHKRNNDSISESEKAKHHLRNLKLKFSRLLTCYATIIAIISTGKIATPESVIKIIKMSPIEKMDMIGSKGSDQRKLIESILKDYSWFLEKTADVESNQLEWISDRENRNIAFTYGREFGSKIYELLQISADDTTLRYFLV